MTERSSRIAAAIALGAGAAAAVGAVAGSAFMVGTALARLAVTPARRPEEGVVVEAVERRDDGVVVRLRGADVGLPGRYSLLFDEGSGHARLGEALEAGLRTAVRPVVAVDRGELRPGARGRVTGWWYTDPAQLGLACETIVYPTELGDAQAWLVRPARARKRRWAVHVHGRGALPAEAIRGAAPLARAGVTSLIISYRNDPGAPAGAHGRYGAGLSESRDVDAAIAEALRRGAERVTLVGWSMGGTACLVSATRGAHAASVDGVILDSPAVGWRSLLRHQAGGRRVPAPVADIGIGLLDRGVVRAGEPGGIAFESLTPERFARDISVPVLIHASRDDTFVPCGPAERLAALRPELVQLHEWERAEHVKLWNVEPGRWERITEAFARALPRPGWRG